MDPMLLQRTRYVLHARFRQAQRCPVPLFVPRCGHLYRWLGQHPLLRGNLQRLHSIETNASQEVEDIMAMLNGEQVEQKEVYYAATTPEEHAAVCYQIVRGLALLSELPEGKHFPGLANMAAYFTKRDYGSPQDAVEDIRDVALDGLFEYLDETLDSRGALYAILLKYKQRCEWFRRERLRAAADGAIEGKTGERALAVDLYEYILNQGVDFAVEPSSGSGEIDLVLRDPDGRYLLIEAKYIREHANRGQIVRKLGEGFHQLARYCHDYNEPTGFLVVYICAKLRINLELLEADGLQYQEIGGKKCFYIPIHISDEPPASRSGTAEEISVKSDELVRPVNE